MSDGEWAGYVFLRNNPKGVHRRTLEPSGRLPALVQHAAQHRDRRNPRGLQVGVAPEVSANLPPTPSGEAIGRLGQRRRESDGAGRGGSPRHEQAALPAAAAAG